MDLNSIFHDGILIDVNIRFWSGAKVLEAEDLGLKEVDVTEAFHLGKKMLVPQDIIHAFRAIEARARREVEINSFPFPIGMARFIPRKRFKGVLEALKEYQKAYNEKANDLILNYETYRQQMIPLYRKAAEMAWTNRTFEVNTLSPNVEADKQAFIDAFLARVSTYYPPAESLRVRFGLNWELFEVSMPRLGEASSDGIIEQQLADEEYRKQWQNKIGSFVGDVVTALRTETAEICSRIVNNIKSGKVIKSTTLDSLKTFIGRFQELNFVGDTTVEQQLNSLRTEFLDKYSSEDVRESTELQEVLTRKLGELSEVVETTDVNSVTGEYKRKIAWTE
jgi:hypothetical protein